MLGTLHGYPMRCAQLVTYQDILDTFGPDVAIVVWLGIHTTQTRHLEELCIWVDEIPATGLEGDRGRYNDGVGTGSSEGQEA